MNNELTKKDMEVLLESMEYTKLKYEEYQKYPSYEYKQKRVSEAQELIAKLKELKNSLN